MLATILQAPGDIRIERVPDPALQLDTDAIVRVVAACVCGSDLWSYRGVVPVPKPRRIGHEFIGIVEAVGEAVEHVAVGDFVIAPFYVCDGTCVNCRNGMSSACTRVSMWGAPDSAGIRSDGGQGERVRVPLADGTLFVVDGPVDEADLAGLLTLSDVMGTGHHAAVSAGVEPGETVAVIGDGAVGLCGVIAAKRLGASRILVASRNPERQALAVRFGATDIVTARGDEGAAEMRALTGGVGADRVLECVGTPEAMEQAIRSARPGGQVGFVGVPHGTPETLIRLLFDTNVGVRGGMAPVRGYMAELLPDVRSGAITPGDVFDLTVPLRDAAAAYAAMDERRAIKAMLRP